MNEWMNERRKSRTKASISHLHSTFTFSGKSRTKASLSHLALSLLFERSLARQLRSHIFHFHFLRTSRTTVSFSHLALSLFEGSLARELRFHIFHFHFLRDVSHDSFVLTSCTFTFWGKSRTRAPFSYLPLSLFEGSFARKLRFHIFHVHFLRKVSHEMCFESSRVHEMLCFAGENVSQKMDGEACPAGRCGTRSFQSGSCSDRPRAGTDSSGVVLLTFLRVLLLCFATQPLQIAL